MGVNISRQSSSTCLVCSCESKLIVPMLTRHLESNILVTRNLSSSGVGNIEDYMPVVTQPRSTLLDLDAGIFLVSPLAFNCAHD